MGNDLRIELNKGYNIGRISTWACDLLVEIRYEHSLEIKNILRHISLMDAGPEFEYSEKELNLLVEMLINEVDDPIGKINAMNG